MHYNRRVLISSLILYFTTFAVIIPYITEDCLFSTFRSSKWNKRTLEEKALLMNQNKVIEAKNYLRTLEINSIWDKKNDIYSQRVHMVVVIVTVKRVYDNKPLGYLTRVAAAMDRLLKNDRQQSGSSSKLMFICNVYAGPGVHKEALDLGTYFNIVQRFPNGSIEATIMNPFEKEKQDYEFCLREAIKLSPEWILFVEDDAVPRDDLFATLRYVIERKSTNSQLSFFKLYYPERWQGYSFETRKIVELLAVFCLGGYLFLVIQLLVTRRLRSLLNRANVSFFIYGGMYFTLLALSFSRQHLIELRRVSSSTYQLTPAPDCCSPSILYPYDIAEKLVNHLKSVQCGHLSPLDAAFDKFSVQFGYPVYLVEPNLFRHIGLVSSIKGFGVHPRPEEFLT